eukprot:1168748-Rhodomonas_salina.1
MGNRSRFLNHSCLPNAHLHPILVRGEFRVGVVLGRGILAREEITIRYEKSTSEEDLGTECLCGEEECGGWLRG